MLTTRIAHILATGKAYPSQILAVTFTNKAAREMKQRIGILVGEGAVEGMPWLGTFHSIGVKLLRRHAELAGLKSDFTILDTDDVVRLIKQIIQAEGLDDKRWPAKQFALMIDGWKNKGLGPAEIPEGDARIFANGKGRELYTRLSGPAEDAQRLRFRRSLCHPIRIFRAYPDVLKEYHAQFRYILVDEYQDTNTAQYMWLRLLAQRPAPRSGLQAVAIPGAQTAAVEGQSGPYRPPARSLEDAYEWATSAEGRKPDRASEPARPRGGPRRQARTARERKQGQHLLRRRRRPVHLWLARRRGRQHPALRQGFSRRDHHQAGAQLSLDRAHPRRRFPPHRPQ